MLPPEPLLAGDRSARLERTDNLRGWLPGETQQPAAPGVCVHRQFKNLGLAVTYYSFQLSVSPLKKEYFDFKSCHMEHRCTRNCLIRK